MTKFQSIVEYLGTAVVNFNTDTFKIALSDTAPDAATNAVLADITQIAAGNGYVAGGFATVASYSSSGGTGTQAINNPTLTASGGSIGPFRYMVFYDSTPSGGKLVGYQDLGVEVTIGDGNSMTVSWSTANVSLTLS